MTVSPINTSRIQSAIAQASSTTGVDFDYLMGQAKLESGFNANARSDTSSASGLYQFIESSWLGIVKKHGAEHGMGWAANSIGQTASGRYTVAPGARQAILNLRNDPAAASLMAAEHAADNKGAIEGSLGRAATGTDLYMAHFLGIGGATKFLSARERNPDASAAALFPSAARANRSVFYASNGSPRTLEQVYQRFATKLGAASDTVDETRNANLTFAAQALNMGDATVVTGNNESAADALSWAQGKLEGATNSVLRPTPDTARLAYMMLSRMGN